jgi:hypothetical protein
MLVTLGTNLANSVGQRKRKNNDSKLKCGPSLGHFADISVQYPYRIW